MSESTCPVCNSALPDGGRACPFCAQARAVPALEEGRLARDSGWSGADGLARLEIAAPLARSESIDALTRELETDAGGPLMLAELKAVSERLAGDAAPSLTELEGLLAMDVAPVSFDGIQLAGLMERGAQDQALLRKGLVLVKHRRYAEAVEWWTLHREGLDPSRQRLELLLLLLEAFTHQLAGNAARAKAVRAQVAAHPLYQQLRGRGKR